MSDLALDELGQIIGSLGDRCIMLGTQRRWLTEALEAYAAALGATLEAVAEDGGDAELQERVVRSARAILSERADFSEETIIRVFGRAL